MYNVYTAMTNGGTLNDIYLDVHFRHHNKRNVKYHNITPDYNGVMIPGEEFFKYPYKRVYDNGIYIHNDYGLTDLPPVFMYALFPKRHFNVHNVDMTYIANDLPIYERTYWVKWKNLSEDDMQHLRDREIGYMSNNLMWVDYIDHRCSLIVEGTIMLNDVHYEILCPNLIEFKTRPFELPENDDIEVKVIYEGIFEEVLLRDFEHKSNLYKMYNHPDATAIMFEQFETNFAMEVDDIRKEIIKTYPERYKEFVHRHHMMLTKYFSTEQHLLNGATAYGLNWFNELNNEFPEFIRKGGKSKVMLNWEEIDKSNLTWAEWDANGGFMNTHKSISDVVILTNPPQNLLDYDDNLYFKTDEEREFYLAEKAKLINKRVDGTLTQEDEDIFNSKYSSNLYEFGDDGDIIDIVRELKELPRPRNVMIPPRESLNKILTNHAIATNYIRSYNKLNTSYLDLKMFKHDNEEAVGKTEDNGLDHHRGLSIIEDLIDKDSTYNPNIPWNFMVVPNKKTYHEEDLAYFDTEPYSIDDSDKYGFIEKEEQNLEPDVDADERWIRFLPRPLENDHIDEMFYNIRQKYTTMRDLINAKYGEDFIEREQIIEFVTYMPDNVNELRRIGLDTDLKELEGSSIVSNKSTDTAVIIPVYKYDTLFISMGKTENLKNNAENIYHNVVVSIDVPRRTSPTYPHLNAPSININTIEDLLYKNYKINLDNLDRFKNGNDIKLFEYYPPRTYVPYLTIGYTNTILTPLGADKYVEYFNDTPSIIEIEPKYIRFFNMGAVSSSMITQGPKFILPAEYSTKSSDHKYNLSELTHYYENNRGIPFIKYIVTDEALATGVEQRITELSEQEKALYKNYINEIASYNRYEMVGRYDGVKNKINANYVSHVLFTDKIFDNKVDLIFTKDKEILFNEINGSKRTYKTDLPFYMDTSLIANISISALGNEPKYVLWDPQDGNIEDDYIGNAEITVSKIKPVNITDNYKGVSFNVFDEFDILKYDPIDDEYDTLFTYSGNATADYTKIKKLGDKVYIRANNTIYRLIDIQAFKVYSYILYHEYLSRTNNDNFALDIITDRNGQLDFNLLYNRFDYNPENNLINTRTIRDWSRLYGYFTYIPRKTTLANFTNKETIDIALNHNGFRLEICVQDSKHNLKPIINRATDEPYFDIKGDKYFLDFIRKPIHYDILDKFITSVEGSVLKRSPAEIEIIHPYYRQTEVINPDSVRTIEDILMHASQDVPNGYRFSDIPPIIRLVYSIAVGDVDRVIETYDKERYKDFVFAHDNYLGFKVGLGSVPSLIEYDAFFDNAPGLDITSDITEVNAIEAIKAPVDYDPLVKLNEFLLESLDNLIRRLPENLEVISMTELYEKLYPIRYDLNIYDAPKVKEYFFAVEELVKEINKIIIKYNSDKSSTWGVPLRNIANDFKDFLDSEHIDDKIFIHTNIVTRPLVDKINDFANRLIFNAPIQVHMNDIYLRKALGRLYMVLNNRYNELINDNIYEISLNINTHFIYEPFSMDVNKSIVSDYESLEEIIDRNIHEYLSIIKEYRSTEDTKERKEIKSNFRNLIDSFMGELREIVPDTTENTSLLDLILGPMDKFYNEL